MATNSPAAVEPPIEALGGVGLTAPSCDGCELRVVDLGVSGLSAGGSSCRDLRIDRAASSSATGADVLMIFIPELADAVTSYVRERNPRLSGFASGSVLSDAVRLAERGVA